MALRWRLRLGNEGGTLGGTGLADGVAQTIEFSAAPNFPTLGTDEYIVLILDTDESVGAAEIVYLTTYTSGAVTGTIQRAQEGTTGRAHAAGVEWDHGPTPADFNGFMSTTGGAMEKVGTNTAAGATPVIDLIDGNAHDVTLTANATFTFQGARAGYACAFSLLLRQDAVGGWTVTWPTSVKWDSATVPTLTTTASAIDLLVFTTYDGGTTWLGSLAGSNYS